MSLFYLPPPLTFLSLFPVAAIKPLATQIRPFFHSTEAWPEILPALFECTKSPSHEHRESAFRIFTSVPDLISGQHVDILKSVFASSLRDENLHVRDFLFFILLVSISPGGIYELRTTS